MERADENDSNDSSEEKIQQTSMVKKYRTHQPTYNNSSLRD